MNRRYGISVTRRRSSTRVLEGRNRISPRRVYEDHIDLVEMETRFLLATMRNMRPEEASAVALQAVRNAELALTEAAVAIREAEAAEAEAQATAQAVAMFAAARVRNHNMEPPSSEESGSRAGEVKECPSD